VLLLLYKLRRQHHPVIRGVRTTDLHPQLLEDQQTVHVLYMSKQYKFESFIKREPLQPIGCSVEAVATMIGCLPTQALAFSQVPSKRNARNASDCVWMETGLHLAI